ncbi:MAG: division/cell wall cluster transcriptional repressor MraZ [Alphaproteobacteria bacterium]
MALYLSTFINRIDRKGRVSVPAPFRAALAGEPYTGIVVFPSFRESYNAIEACGMARMERLSASLDRLNPFSDEHDDFASVIFGASVQLPFDGEGRIILPPHLLEHAAISDQAAFVGRGATFQIWEPGALHDFQNEAQRRARAARATLKLDPSAGDGS